MLKINQFVNMRHHPKCRGYITKISSGQPDEDIYYHVKYRCNKDDVYEAIFSDEELIPVDPNKEDYELISSKPISNSFSNSFGGRKRKSKKSRKSRKHRKSRKSKKSRKH